MRDFFNINFDLIVIDYMGLMQPCIQQGSDWLNLGAVSAELHEFARAYNVPIVTASQVNRTKDPTKQNYGTSRIARSGMVPTNANIIVQLGWRGEDEYTRIDAPLYVIKNRDGELTSLTLIKNFAHMRIKDMVDDTFVPGDDTI